LQKYKLVINSAMFEHVIDRESLDFVDGLVADDGVLMLHTFISATVPQDPNWFYLEPHVHTAFHTNRSMDILLGDWGYAASVYAPEARSWFIYKRNAPQLDLLEEKIRQINAELQREYFFFKRGFVDYWK
jgi:hypothetical protein